MYLLSNSNNFDLTMYGVEQSILLKSIIENLLLYNQLCICFHGIVATIFITAVFVLLFCRRFTMERKRMAITKDRRKKNDRLEKEDFWISKEYREWRIRKNNELLEPLFQKSNIL